MIIDTHAHLYYKELTDNLEVILENAEKNGIEKIIIPAVDLKTSEVILNMCEKNESLFSAVGIHPSEVKSASKNDIKFIEEFTSHKKVVAIGEIGLDYYWDRSYNYEQKVFFNEFIELANDKCLPIIIHTRDSVDDAIKIVKERFIEGKTTGQFHCYSGDINQMKEILELKSFYFSFGGNVTYKNYKDYTIIEYLSVERLLFETDSPFLPPVPNRGKKNEPSFIVFTIKKIAEIKKMDMQTLIQSVYANTLNLFNFNR
jgi:TatD DNase family protein